MHGSERREQIIRQIQESKAPVSGTKLASLYSVSRQVIVQDIALIRAAGYEIISTNRGYILNQPKTVCRIFKVQHTDEQLEEELNTIVDLGGCVDNVMIHHRVYGKMEAELALSSRRKVGAFMEDIRSGKSSPLKNITSNYHYHKVSADSEETLDLIEQELREKGFLVEERRQAVWEIRTDISVEELAHDVLVLERGIIMDWCVQNGSFSLGYYGSRSFDLYIEFMRVG